MSLNLYKLMILLSSGLCLFAETQTAHDSSVSTEEQLELELTTLLDMLYARQNQLAVLTKNSTNHVQETIQTHDKWDHAVSTDTYAVKYDSQLSPVLSQNTSVKDFVLHEVSGECLQK